MYNHIPSVLYYDNSNGHKKPSLEYLCDNPDMRYIRELIDNYDGQCNVPLRLFIGTSCDDSRTSVTDQNYSYNLSKLKNVRDSCVFAHLNQRNVYLYGMDYMNETVRLPSKIFRILCVLCGTDFTRSLLTSSLVNNLMRNINMTETAKAHTDLQYIVNNTKFETDICLIYLILVAMRGADLNRSALPLMHDVKSKRRAI